MRIRWAVALCVGLLVAACEPPPESPPILPTPEELRAVLGGRPFDDFVERSFAELLRRSPEAVIELGLQSSIDVGHSFLNDVSDEFEGQTFEVVQVVAEVLRTYDRAAQEGGFVAASQVVAEYEAIIDDAWGRLDQAFDLRPTADVIVIGVPSGGYYVGASLDGSRPGAFYATVGGNGLARYGMRTLAYHEAVPGHHLQIGVAADLQLPLFRRVTTFTGSVEGWALYAEWMAGALGWYAGDPHGDVGRLQSQAFRAARLVVDTGIHARGWSFDRAVQELMDATGYGRGFCQGQVIRYASWPGQATAYWTGAKKIRELRARAESAKGAAFDLKAFHRAVLSHGSLPLELMLQMAAEDLALP